VDGDPDGGAIVAGSDSVWTCGKRDSGAESDPGSPVGRIPDSVEEDETGLWVGSVTTETDSVGDVRGLSLVGITA
jgi:hypothetical protein